MTTAPVDVTPPGPGPDRSRPSLVYVVGSPRSGTTYLGSALGSLPGFADCGELLKPAIPQRMLMEPVEAGREMIAELASAGVYTGGAGPAPVIHSPELVFLIPALLTDPAAVVIHLVRDGRDVVVSLLEQGWLNDAGRRGQRRNRKLAGHQWEYLIGSDHRFWVEPGRRREFRRVSDARRAAWAWRRHAEAGLSHEPIDRLLRVRYEDLIVRDPAVTGPLASLLGTRRAPVEAVLAGASPASVGRWRRQLAGPAAADVDVEAGALLRALGYGP